MPSSRKPKSPAETPKAGALVAQPHGGALRHGSEPGGPAGPGRPPSELRELMRKSLEERLPILEEIADDPDASPADRIKAIELLARYGLGATLETKIESRSLEVRADATSALVAQAMRDPGVRAFVLKNPDIIAGLPDEAQRRLLPPSGSGESVGGA